MNTVNLANITEKERRSPKGKYHSFRKEVSVALGREPASMELGKRHPFDLMVARLPPGAALCPYHSHSAQWELYLVISGKGLVRDDAGRHEVAAGDAFVFGPGEAHQITNPGPEDLVYHVIADNPLGDSCHYPDSKKWAVGRDSNSRKIVLDHEADYLDGEE